MYEARVQKYYIMPLCTMFSQEMLDFRPQPKQWSEEFEFKEVAIGFRGPVFGILGQFL